LERGRAVDMGIDWSPNRDVADNILGAVGRTPLVRLEKIRAKEGVSSEILGKVEFVNPTGSHKDRAYYEMITRAVERGVLRPRMEILEASSGNAGISCAFIGGMLGFKVTIAIPEGMSRERMKTLQAYGARIITTPGGESDIDLSIMKVMEMKEKDPKRYWVPNQFSNPDNISAHYRTTGAEIWEQTHGEIECFVAASGTGATITGAGRYLKERNPRILLYTAEPEEAPTISKGTWGFHSIDGIGDGFIPHNLDLSLLKGVVVVSSREAISMARSLCKEEGLLCGVSSGCNVAAAVKIAMRHPEIKTIVTMINDTGQRYFSTELFGEAREIEIPEREHPLDQHSLTQLEKYRGELEIIE
jgi:cysteine synthase A